MITRCFTFLQGIGQVKQAALYNTGITNWDLFLSTKNIKGIFQKRKLFFDSKLIEAKRALASHNLQFFTRNFPKRELWRLYYEFKEDCCFLDLEADSYGKIIIITLFDRFESKSFLKYNFHSFAEELSKHKLLITYNGSVYDLPKIKKQLKVKITQPHIDLKPLCARLGLKGGLKDIEKQLGIPRPANLHGSPVSLWKTFHASGDKEYLDLLVQYNEEDTVNLYRLAEKIMAKITFQAR